MFVSRKEGCPKNHIIHLEEEDHEGNITKTAKWHFVHHKNERRDGSLTLPMGLDMVEVVEMMEKASKYLAPDCPSLLCGFGTKRPFDDAPFSQFCTKVMSQDYKHTTATQMRHAFSTLHRDWQLSRGASQEAVDEEEVAAAALMGNRPASWDATYDERARVRPMERVLAGYPAFKAWVKAKHAHKKQQRPRDPTA